MAGEKTIEFMDLLTKDRCGSRLSRNALTALWRKLAFETRLHPARYHILLDHYMSQLNLPYQKTKNIKGNLTKSLVEPEFSWDIFCKGLIIFNYKVTKVHFSVDLLNDKSVSANVSLFTYYRYPSNLTFDKAVEENGKLLTLLRDRLMGRIYKSYKLEDNDSVRNHCKMVDPKLNGNKLNNLITTINGKSDSVSYKKLMEALSVLGYKALSITVELRSGPKERLETIVLRP